MQNERFKLSGLNCGHCVNTVKTALENIEGVASANVNLENQLVDISYNGETAGEEKFKAAVEGEGFGFLGKE